MNMERIEEEYRSYILRCNHHASNTKQLQPLSIHDIPRKITIYIVDSQIQRVRNKSVFLCNLWYSISLVRYKKELMNVFSHYKHTIKEKWSSIIKTKRGKLVQQRPPRDWSSYKTSTELQKGNSTSTSQSMRIALMLALTSFWTLSMKLVAGLFFC